MQQSSRTTGGIRRVAGHFVGVFAPLLLSVGLLWSATAKAVDGPSTYPGCDFVAVTVPYGGSVDAGLTGCHFFGLGTVFTAPVHGTADPVSEPVIDYTYSHNGSSGTTDQFVVRDDNSDFITVNVTIEPPTSAISVLPGSLPAMTAGTAFSQTLTSAGGTAPYTYTLGGGTLPMGLTLASNGVLSGTPTQRGGYSFTVTSTDANTDSANKAYSGTVAAAPLSLNPAAVTAIQGVAFSEAIGVNGGLAPHTFLLESGSFPAGISISSAGLVSGTTAAAPGAYPVTLRVTDASTGPGSHFELETLTFNVSAAPAVTIAVTPASVSEDGATNLSFTVTRSLNLASATVVNLTTTGTASSATDYTGAVATATIPAGATTATVVIDPTVDTTIEADETVILTVAAGTGYTVGATPSATGTLLNDDVPVATIAVAPASVSEDGASSLVYTVTFDQASLTPVSVSFSTAGSTATSGSDYAAVTSPLVIPAGALSGTITVDPNADVAIEANETVIISLGNFAGYTLGTPNSVTGTILNDDLPNLTINDVTLAEGNAGTTNATFTVSLSAAAGPGGVTFDIATADNTATAGVDYVANSLTGQTIAAGNNSASFVVVINGDALNETSETLFVNVTNVTGAVVADAQGVGTLVNDDPLPSFTIADATVVEGNAGTVNADFVVTLGAASGQTVTVNFATANGTATAGTDYTANSGTLTFPAGTTQQTVSVLVNGDTTPEANETFTVGLSAASNATIADASGAGSITNDDVPVTVAPGTLPNATVAAAYSQTISASGGSAPYTFAVTAGALPAGLILAADGTLAGTPTASGLFNFTVTGTDASGAPGPYSGSQAYTLTVNAPTITVAPTTLPDGTRTLAYSETIIASNGTAPYSYAVTAGALPSGLALASDGSLTGTPTAVGNFNFTVTATDSSTGAGPHTGSRAYVVSIVDLVPVAGNVSTTVAYNSGANPVTLAITDGVPSSVAVATGASNGTALASGTSITYQPNAGYAGADSFTYTATNASGTSAPATVTVTVSNPTITVVAGDPLTATVGTAYTQTFTWAGGAAPYSGYAVTGLPAGLSITGTGTDSVTVSGTPTEAGSFALNASADDSSTGNGPFNTAQGFTLDVAAPTLVLNPASGALPAPTYNAAYSQAFAASGGNGPYTYALAGGALPGGMSFAGDTVSGTPTQAGTFNFSITATDTGSTGAGAPFTVTGNYSLTVAAPTITLDPATLPAGNAAAPYTQAITASGGVAPYSFAVTAGAVPPGLSLGSTGTLSGTSVVAGDYNFTVTATDANGFTGAAAYTLTIGPPNLAIAPASGSNFTAAYNTPFSQVVTASGGQGPYSYALVGTLPAGITLVGGTISGSATEVGAFNFDIVATDTGTSGVGAPFTVTGSYSLTVTAQPITLDPATLADATVAVAYSQSFTANNGIAPYVFTLTGGALPTGFSLASDGTLSGTTAVAGTYNFTLTAEDGGGRTGAQAYTLTVLPPVLAIAPADGSAFTGDYNVAFSQVFSASGGTGPYSYALTGTLPAGLAFAGNTLSGTPTESGSFSFSVVATDTGSSGTGSPFTVTGSYTLDVAAATIVLDPAALPDGAVSAAYSQAITASGGVGPYGFTVTGGALPAGLTLAADGTLSGTPTAAGSFNVTVTATDANGQTGSQAYTLAVLAPTLVIAPADGSNFAGDYNVAFSQVFSASGGTGPYSYALTGTLPAGLSFAGDTLSGTPTESGSFSFSVVATDTGSSGTGSPFTVTGSYTLDVAAATIVLDPAALPDGAVSAAYSQAITASGGVGPYGFTVTGGALPAGLTLAADGTLSGTPTAAGSFNVTVTATDANGQTGSQAYALAITAPVLVIAPADGSNFTGDYNVAFSQVFSASGGTGPYSYALTGTLPAGLSFTGDTLSGTPTESGSFSFSVVATDTGSSGTGSPFTVTGSYTLDVAAATIVLDPAALPDGAVSAAYSQAITASGGVGPYGFTVTGGALPAGLTLAADGTLSGTPTAAGSFNVTVTATDANGQTGSQAYALAITAPVLVIAPADGSNFTGDYNVAFSQVFSASGGTGPYSYALTGTLPAGLAFAGDTLSGTPTESGSFSFSVVATDTGSSGTGSPFTVTGNYTLDVAAATIVLDPAALPDGAVSAAYSQAITASGGVGPYGYSLTGTLPAGLAFAADGTLSGTPTEAGSFNVTVTATDANGQTGSQAYTLVVTGPVLAITPADGTVFTVDYNTAVNQVFAASGGVGPYTYALAGTLPNGVSFASGTLAGTPTQVGTYSFTVTATDTGSTGTGAPFTVSASYSLVVNAASIVLDPAALPDGTAGIAYSQAITASGGVAPYGFTVTAGALPAGLTLAADGTLSGTPTAAGSFAFTVTATDANGQAGALAYTLDIAAPVLSITPATLPAGVQGTAYAASLTASGGTAPYSFAVTGGALPAGLVLASDGALSGTPTTVGNSSFTVTATDALGFSASVAYTISITDAAPVAVDDVATVLAGEAVSIAVTGNDTGVISSIAIATAPTDGTAVVNGLVVEYTAAAGAPGDDSFTYTVTGPGGTSAPATVAVTVNPVPSAVSREFNTLPELPVLVELTDGATGGPFTGATVVALTPATSGTAVITPSAAGFLLTYTPAEGFTGLATVEFTLENAFATSAPATITITVEPRPDPSTDPEVLGVLDAQVESTRRFATTQIGNFQQRLERLHGGGQGDGFENGIGFSIDRPCLTPQVGERQELIDPCDVAGTAGAGYGMAAAPGDGGRSGRGGSSPLAFWTGGMIRSGSQDGRDGRADIDFETDGISAGADYRVNDQFAFGAGIGWGQDDNEIGSNGSFVEGDATTFALYASFHPGERFFLDGLLGYQRLSFDTKRYVSVTDGFVRGQRDGTQWFASISAGSDIALENGAQLTPYARLDLARASLDGYTETGDPIYALRYGAMDVDTTTGNLGLRMEFFRETSWGRFVPQLRLEYQHDFDGRSTGTVQYADLVGGPLFGLQSQDLDRNRWIFGLGAMLQTAQDWSFRLEYRGQVGSDGERDNGLLLNVQKTY